MLQDCKNFFKKLIDELLLSTYEDAYLGTQKNHMKGMLLKKVSFFTKYIVRNFLEEECDLKLFFMGK